MKARRMLATLLSVLMLVSLLPVSALAAGAGSTWSVTVDPSKVTPVDARPANADPAVVPVGDPVRVPLAEQTPEMLVDPAAEPEASEASEPAPAATRIAGLVAPETADSRPADAEPAANGDPCTLDVYIQPSLDAGIAIAYPIGAHYVGQKVTLIATPKSGYRFVAWVNYATEEVSFDSQHAVTLTGDCEWDAIFIRNGEYFIYVNQPLDMTVSPDNYSFTPGTQITLTAPPKEGRSIAYDIGPDVDGHASSVTWSRIGSNGKFTMPAYHVWTRALYSNFITVTVQGHGSYELTPGPYYEGGTATLTLSPEEGYYASSITGVPTGYTASGNVITFPTDYDADITVEFSPIPGAEVTFGTFPGNKGTIEHSVNEETGMLTVEATPVDGYTFLYWVDYDSVSKECVALSAENPYSFVPEHDMLLVAIFGFVYPSTDAGTVQTVIEDNGDVTLTAVPTPGYQFSFWMSIGDQEIVSYDAAYTAPPSVSIALAAAFQQGTRKIYMYDMQPERGSFTVSPTQSLYTPGMTVELLATPSEGYALETFLIAEYQEGVTHYDLDPIDGTSFVMPDHDVLITAAFCPLYTITAEPSPAEGGFAIGGGKYKEDETVTLTAVPNEGYRFVNWTENGSAVSTDAEYSFTASAGRNLTANFELIPITHYTISASVNPTEGGTVVGAGEYDEGETVTLTAVPNEGYHFVNWTENGSAVSTNAAYSFTASADRSLTANFELNPITHYTISASVNPTEGGTVSGAGEYAEGETVTLTATPNEGYRFVNWTENGSAVSTNAAYSFTASADRSLTANFELISTITYTISASVNPAEGGTVSGAGEYDEGAAVTLTATPNTGWRFLNWTENASVISTDAEYSFTASADRSLTANFEPTTGTAVSYLDPTDETNPNKFCNNYTFFTDQTTLESGWYVVNGDVTISERIEVTGDVNLILCDGAALTAGQGIHLFGTNRLTVWAQSEGEDVGRLEAVGVTCTAGIGSNDGQTGGIFTVNGGFVTARGGHKGAGIGGGRSASNGTFTLNAGVVNAIGGNYSAGVGGGGAKNSNWNGGSGGTVIINGGRLTATGGSYAAGIGGGSSSDVGTNGGAGGSVTVNGGTVTAIAGAHSQAIGYGDGSTDSGSLSIDGMKVYASEEATEPVAAADRIDTCHSRWGKLTLCESHCFDEHTGACIWCGAAGPVPYLDPTDENEPNKTCTEYTVVTGQTELESGWYVVNSNVELSDRITVNGEVHLILVDGYALIAEGGVNVAGGNSLTVYGQSEGTGELHAGTPDYSLPTCPENCAGLGSGENESSSGAITINGGTVYAVGNKGAGIGGGYYSDGAQVGDITINGGTVSAIGDAECAGIGGGMNGDGGNITINGGSVTATCGPSGAGIGGGRDGDGGFITINGGFVTASSNHVGAAIGGGQRGNGGTIIINGGTVTAKSGQDSPGIGGGSNGCSGEIIINDGIVTAVGGLYGAGIGNCNYSGRDSADSITVNGGTVIATGGKNGAGIGGCLDCDGSEVTINGGTVIATGGEGAAGIGGGLEGDTSIVTITGGKVIAIAGENAQAIGHGQDSDLSGSLSLYDAAVVVIDPDTQTVVTGDGRVEACRGPWAAIVSGDTGVAYLDPTDETEPNKYCYLYTVFTDQTALERGWYVVNADTTVNERITVTDSVRLILVDGFTLTAPKGITVTEGNSFTVYGQSGQNGKLTVTLPGESNAGIGGDIGQAGGTITINGGAVTTTGGTFAASIGGGYGGAGGKITINGGTVTTTGGDYAAGIGGGHRGAGGEITINGGTVTATGGENAAGIGGGDACGGGIITINGGTVTATGTNFSAGIGGGDYGAGGEITINGGTVTTTGGDSAAGIGGGHRGAGGEITINGGTVTATGGENAAGIGGGDGGAGGIITISGGTVTATGTNFGAGIGGGDGGAGGIITISGGTVTAIGSPLTAGIGAGGILNDSDTPTGTILLTYDDTNGIPAVPEVTASSYIGTVQLGKGFREKDGAAFFVPTDSADGDTLAAMAGKTLVPAELFTISLIKSTEGGTVSGGGTYVSGTSVTVTATSNPGYVFDGWKEGGGVVSTDASYTFTVTGDRTLTACFVRVYTVTVVNGTADVTTAKAGETVTITANDAAYGYGFVQWAMIEGVEFDRTDGFTTTFVMPEKDVTLTAVFRQIILPDIPDKVYTGEEIRPTVHVELDGVDSILQEGYEYVITYADNTNAGTATLTVTFINRVTGEPDARCGIKSTTFTILPADISTATVEIADQTYTGEALTPEPTVTWNGQTLTADDYTLSYENNTNAGQATVTVTGKGNFYENTSVSGNFTINKAPLTIKADNQTKVYDNDPATDPALTATVTGKPVNGAAPVYTLSREAGQNAGDYAITVTADAEANPNYAITAESGSFTISKAPLTIKAENKTKVYDNDPATDPALTATVTGKPVNGAAPVYTLSREAGQNAGDYAITVTAEADSNPNYTITVESGTFTISARDGVVVTITGHYDVTLFDGQAHTVSGYDVAYSDPLYTEADFIFTGNAEATGTEIGTTYMGLTADQFENVNQNFINVTFEVTDGYQTILHQCANGHDLIHHDAQAPTCTEIGWEAYDTCSRCDFTTYAEIAALGHDYQAVVTEPTCTEAGYTTHTCTRCSDNYTDGETSALGHAWDDGEVTTEPCHQRPGVKTFTCTRCSETRTEDVPRLPNPFEDVHDEDYFFDPVMWALDNGVTAGVDETHYGPEQDCTRGQIMTFLWRACGSPEPKGTESPFSDVTPNDYYFKAVLWAAENGITVGMGDGTFGAELACTRSQAMTFLWRAKGSPEPETTESAFSDVTPDDYYFKAVLWAAETQVTVGISDELFGVEEACTRAQIITFLHKAYTLPDD